jgi:hypothetical protein
MSGIITFAPLLFTDKQQHPSSEHGSNATSVYSSPFTENADAE